MNFREVIFAGIAAVAALGTLRLLVEKPWLPPPASVRETLDPRLTSFTGFQPSCEDADASYAWICGRVIRMPGPNVGRACTAEDRPLFVGSLSIPGQMAFHSQTMFFHYEFPLRQLKRCSDDIPSSTFNCATVLLHGKSDSTFGYFKDQPPDRLPQDFPPPPYEYTGHSLATMYFAELNGKPVALYYTEWIGLKPGRPPDQCRLSTHLAQLNVGIDLELPCVEMASWRTHLQEVIDAVENGIISSEPATDCGIPPEEAIIRGNPFDSDFTKNMPLWLDLYR